MFPTQTDLSAEATSPLRPAEYAVSPSAALKTIGIIGAGVMGCGLAEALTSTGHHVILVDRSQSLIDEARTVIRKSLRASRLLTGGAEPLSAIMARLQLSMDLTSIASAEFVVENITEIWDLKAALYARVGTICGSDIVVAANTSTFPIDELASLINHPERVIGMHFMNPVPAKQLVEVIPGRRTSPDTLGCALRLLAQMGKEAIIVGDGPGFVSNRILMLTINEAILVVDAQLATVHDVDRLFRGCFGHPMGPLATADLIGLDTILLSLESLKLRCNDVKFEPSSLLKRMVAAGTLGRKSGSGFFEYPDGR